MRKQHRQSFVTVLSIVLLTFFSLNCGDQKPESKPPVVSKKITVQRPTEQPKPVVTGQTAAPVTAPDAGPGDAGTPQLAKRIYDPKARLNPFTPLFRVESPEAAAPPSEKAKRLKRVPQTPLEKIGLAQLKLVGIIRAASGNRALVEDSSGKGYIIKKGTYIGLNSGIVTQIDASSIFVEEEIENLMGELVLQNTEIKLQKPAGE